MAKVKVTPMQDTELMRPGLTPQARENQLIALAYDLVEKRLREGTATSQETTHFLKMGSPKEQRERLKLEKEIEALEAKTEALKSQKQVEELYARAIDAMQLYSGKRAVGEADD